jgi:hypothetical protein
VCIHINDSVRLILKTKPYHQKFMHSYRSNRFELLESRVKVIAFDINFINFHFYSIIKLNKLTLTFAWIVRVYYNFFLSYVHIFLSLYMATYKTSPFYKNVIFSFRYRLARKKINSRSIKQRVQVKMTKKCKLI